MTSEALIDRTDYLPGVPCWIDTEQPDPHAAADFYGGIFGWEFENKLPPEAPGAYLVARLHGFDVAAIASPEPGVTITPAWNTYVSVADADATAAKAAELGGEVLAAPADVGPPGAVAGRWAALRDREGAELRIWQPGYRRGAQLVNAPGAWNSSDLVTPDPSSATAYYGALFGWQADAVEFGGGGGEAYMWRLPGYGDFLAVRDPDIKRRHAEPWVPEGFSDAIGWMSALGGTADEHVARWTVTFSVADTDDVVERAVKLGGTVLSPPTDHAGGVLRLATLRDPQGAELTVGSYDPTRAEG